MDNLRIEVEAVTKMLSAQIKQVIGNENKNLEKEEIVKFENFFLNNYWECVFLLNNVSIYDKDAINVMRLSLHEEKIISPEDIISEKEKIPLMFLTLISDKKVAVTTKKIYSNLLISNKIAIKKTRISYYQDWEINKIINNCIEKEDFSFSNFLDEIKKILIIINNENEFSNSLAVKIINELIEERNNKENCIYTNENDNFNFKLFDILFLKNNVFKHNFNAIKCLKEINFINFVVKNKTRLLTRNKKKDLQNKEEDIISNTTTINNLESSIKNKVNYLITKIKGISEIIIRNSTAELKILPSYGNKDLFCLNGKIHTVKDFTNICFSNLINDSKPFEDNIRNYNNININSEDYENLLGIKIELLKTEESLIKLFEEMILDPLDNEISEIIKNNKKRKKRFGGIITAVIDKKNEEEERNNFEIDNSPELNSFVVGEDFNLTLITFITLTIAIILISLLFIKSLSKKKER
jgi:hypothetical protein